MTPQELYDAGHLDAAIEAARAAGPGPPETRDPLWQWLCFAGDWEQADQQLDLIQRQTPAAADEVRRFRQLIRGEATRNQVFEQGDSPEFLGEPTPALRAYRDALASHRAGQAAEAQAMAAQAEAQRPSASGYCDGLEFIGFRDMDDLTAGFFEVYTPDGKYFWVPIETVVSIEFRRPERPIDHLWRQAHMLLSGGAEAEVFLPALYPQTARSTADLLRLGRDTDWLGQDGELVRGIGLRVFLVGDQDRSILAMDALRFHTPL